MIARRHSTARAARGALPLALLWGLAAAAPSTAEDFADFNELDLEALLDRVVITATRQPQRLGELPVAATVITAEEIAASGASSIPELLRTVPGMDVMRVTGSTYDVCARGLNELGSNSLLVLVDGRSVYADFYGITLWEFLQVPLQAIRAIEIIRGPGSAFYGANAFAGVINILTIDGDELAGHSARSSYSTLGQGVGSLLLAGGDHDFHWRFAGGIDQCRNWEQARDEGDLAQTSAQIGWRWGEASALELDLGGSNGGSLHYPSYAFLRIEGQDQHARLEWRHGGTELRAFWNRLRFAILDADSNDPANASTLDSDNLDLELQRSAQLGSHRLLLGLNARKHFVDWSLGILDRDPAIFAGFAYDEWRLADPLLLSLGLRYDHHPSAGGHLAPRGGIVYRPSPRHALRGSYGIAYRNPSLLEFYWYTVFPGPLGIGQIYRGDEGLNPETIRSLDVGYQGLLHDRLAVSATLFANRLTDLIDIGVAATYPSPPAPQPGIPSEIAFQNRYRWDQRGGEFSLDAQWGARLSSRASYTWVHTEDAGTGARIAQSPAHIGGLELGCRAWRGQQFTAAAHYKSATRWRYANLVTEVQGEGLGDERLTLDLRWRASLGRDRQLVLGVDNAFDARFRDHPLAIEQRRRFVSSLTVGF